MKIICTVTNDLSHDQRMDRICTTLREAGHDVTLVGRVLLTSPELTARPYRQHRIRCEYHSGKAFYLEYNYRLVRELRQWDYDVICSVDADTLAAGAALTRAPRHRLVFDAHEWFHMTPEVIGRPLIKGFWKGLVKSLIGRTDLRYTVAPELAGKLEEDYGRPFATVRNLPVRRVTPYPAPPDRKIILYQGMLNPGRGLEVAIRAMDELPECELWIAGGGPERAQLQQVRDRLLRPDAVRFLGFVPPEQLPALTDRAWLGLNLLDAVSPSYFYSLANKALDYVQAGLPSVQMRFPEYRAINDEYGCYALLLRLSPKDLAELINALVRHPARYDRLRSGCLRAAEDLCWDKEKELLLDLWGRLGDL